MIANLIPVVAYIFYIINCMLAEIRKIDAKARKLITCHKMYHVKADIELLDVKRKNGGRGLIQLELAYKTTTI